MLPGIARDAGSDPPRDAGVLGLFQHGAGRVALYGDSNCLDSSHQSTSCFEFLKPLLAWTVGVSADAATKRRHASVTLGQVAATSCWTADEGQRACLAKNTGVARPLHETMSRNKFALQT